MFGKGWSFTEVSDKIKKKARCGGWVADCGVLDGASDLDPFPGTQLSSTYNSRIAIIYKKFRCNTYPSCFMCHQHHHQFSIYSHKSPRPR